jgi:hypothetical protein
LIQLLSVLAVAGERSAVPLSVQTVFANRPASLDTPYALLEDDDNRPYTVFRFPDAYGDDWRNQSFQAPGNCSLSAALFVFPTFHSQRWSSGQPTLLVRVWKSIADTLTDHSVAYLPDISHSILTDTIPYASYASTWFQTDSAWHDSASQFTVVDLSSHGLQLNAGDWFNVGYSAVFHSPQDSLAIMADDGIPETNSASEFYNGQFVPMRIGWSGVNFFLRVVVDLGANGTTVLRPGSSVDKLALGSAYPNPFNPATTIPFELTQAGQVRMSVFDLLGRERAVLCDRILPAGEHAATVNGSTWSSGIYFARLQTAEGSRTVRIVLEK